MTGLPSYAGTTVSLTSGQALALCSSSQGNTLTVTSPASLPVSQNLVQGESQVVFNFTVSDGRGGTASGSLTYRRP